MVAEYWDVGRHPEHWSISRIGDLASVKGGKRMPAGTALVSSRTSHPYLRIVDFKDGRIEKSALMFVPDDVFPAIARYTISTKDIYISIVGTIGLVGVIDESLEGANLTENAAKICALAEHVDRDFLAAYLRSEAGQNQIKALTVGSTQPKLALFRIEDIRVPLPPLPEQKAIARILGTLDDKIELNRRMNATLEAMARALFQSWFVDFDPVHAKAASHAPSGMDPATAALFPASFQDSELGEIPRGWDAVTLGSVLEVLETGRRPKGGVSGFTFGVPSIGAESIWGIGEFEFGKTKYVPKEFFAKMSSGKVQHLDVLLYKDGGKPGEFRPRVGMFGHNFPFEEFGINEHVFRLRSSSVGQLYLYYSVADPRVLLDFANKGGKAAIPGINQQDVRSALILQPPTAILQKFDEVVGPLVDRMLRNAKESRTLATLRDMLLPKLLSGDLSVVTDQATVEAAP